MKINDNIRYDLESFLNTAHKCNEDVVLTFFDDSLIMEYPIRFKCEVIPALIKNLERLYITDYDISNDKFPDISIVLYETVEAYVRRTERENNDKFNKKIEVTKELIRYEKNTSREE